MKRYFCAVKKILVIFAFWMLLKPVLPVLEYAVNYQYIVTELCINKDKPAVHCNGKCHLMKELAKASDRSEKQLPEKKLSLLESIILFYKELEYFKICYWTQAENRKSHFNYDNSFYTHLISYSLLKPPIFIEF